MVEETTLVPVMVPCDCPEQFTHPDGDVVHLYPQLGLEGGLAVQVSFDVGQNLNEKLTGMYLTLIDHGIAAWNKVDGEGKPVPVDQVHIRARLPWMKGGSTVAAKARELYSDVVFTPFVNLAIARKKAASTTPTSSSGGGRKAKRSTSPTRRGKRKPRAG